MFVALKTNKVHFIIYKPMPRYTKLLLFKRAMNIERFCFEFTAVVEIVFIGELYILTEVPSFSIVLQ